MFWCFWLFQSLNPAWKPPCLGNDLWCNRFDGETVVGIVQISGKNLSKTNYPWPIHRFRISNKRSFELNVTVGTFEKRLRSQATKRTKDVPTIDLHALDPSKAKTRKTLERKIPSRRDGMAKNGLIKYCWNEMIHSSTIISSCGAFPNSTSLTLYRNWILSGVKLVKHFFCVWSFSSGIMLAHNPRCV